MEDARAMMIVSRRGSRLLPPQHYSRASESSADTDVIHHQHHHHLYDDGRRGQQRPGNKIDGLSAAQQRAVTSTAEQNRSTSPTAAAAARPIITSRTCYTSQNRIAYIFINYLFSLILTAPFFLPALPFFLLLLQHSQTSKSQSTRLNSRSSYSSFHKRLAPSKQFQQFFIEFIRIVIYLFTSVCLQSLQISSLPECTKRFHFFT